jgi:uncharacterized protein involved in exopolysaccharide biosynthesis
MLVNHASMMKRPLNQSVRRLQVSSKKPSGWLQDRLAALLKQTMEAEDAVTKFKAKNDIVGAAGKTIIDQRIVELSTDMTETRSQLNDASPSEKQILETSIQNLEAELKKAVSKLRASKKALIKLRELESVAHSFRALYGGLMHRHRAAEANCAPWPQ